MLCKIADLYAEIPEVGDLSSRLGSYKTEERCAADIVVREERFKKERWPGISGDPFFYLESGWHFYVKLVMHGGMMLHSSAVELLGKAYLFSGPPGMGKSTHARLWTRIFPEARIFNDDKPAIRRIGNTHVAYGTPWCGKDGININTHAPIAGICFLKRGSKNEMRRLSKIEAASAILSQTISNFKEPEQLSVLLGIIDGIIDTVPIYELKCTPDEEAARLSHRIMSGEVL